MVNKRRLTYTPHGSIASYFIFNFFVIFPRTSPKYRLLAVLFIVLSFFTTNILAATARVDRTAIYEGETLQLFLKSDASDNSLDLSPLEIDFEVLSTSRSSQMSFINGQMQSSNEWDITLSPKRLGQLTIPSIDINGRKTQALTVSVSVAPTSPNSGAQDVMLKVDIDEKNPFVQSQVVLTIRLLQAVEIRDGGLSEPKLDNAIIERMGADVNFHTTLDSKRYRVTERRYAIFPQASGQVIIPIIAFEGHVMDRGRSRSSQRADPFNRFFQQLPTKMVRLKSELIELDVKPQPSQYQGDWWLPAKSLTLTESWSPSLPEFRVGEPVTRTLQLEAVGLTGVQLPNIINENTLNHFKYYADKPVVKTQDNGQTLIGTLQEKIAIVPTQAGKFELPEINLIWWDIQNNKAQQAVLPSRVVDVLPAIAQQLTRQASASLPVADNINNNSPSEMPLAKSNSGISAGYWPWISAVFAIGWLLTSIAWWRWRQRNVVGEIGRVNAANEQKISPQIALSALQKACLQVDARLVRDELLSWANASWPHQSLQNLTQISQKVDDATFSRALAKLDEILYSPQQALWDGDQFWQQIASRLKQNIKKPKAKNYVIPELYPSK